jgi:uncharacterized protein YndB with AHSA1/START domain
MRRSAVARRVIMQPRYPINLPVQYSRTRFLAAPEHVWDAITRADASAAHFFELAEARSARTGSPIRWRLDEQCAPLHGRIVGWERPKRLDIVLEPDDEFTAFVQVRFELAKDDEGCTLTVVGDPLSECRGMSDESTQRIPLTAEMLKLELETQVPLALEQ